MCLSCVCICTCFSLSMCRCFFAIGVLCVFCVCLRLIGEDVCLFISDLSYVTQVI